MALRSCDVPAESHCVVQGHLAPPVKKLDSPRPQRDSDAPSSKNSSEECCLSIPDVSNSQRKGDVVRIESIVLEKKTHCTK
ncbi:hypothetical protein AB6A40_005245 [Gnathostoma spinigerum]|uniref:Uncharacterized protein n=1 Tax=Gnathostoma spinigerum TaxID=75299 RepID=A0ABD6EM77_9BILA